MSKVNGGGAAFPQLIAFSPNGDAVTAGAYFAEGPGMSLRAWFAGMERLADCDADGGTMNIKLCEALAGPSPTHRWDCKTPEEWLAIIRWEAKWRAALRYLRADAMLEAMEEKP